MRVHRQSQADLAGRGADAARRWVAPVGPVYAAMMPPI